MATALSLFPGAALQFVDLDVPADKRLGAVRVELGRAGHRDSKHVGTGPG